MLVMHCTYVCTCTYYVCLNASVHFVQFSMHNLEHSMYMYGIIIPHMYVRTYMCGIIIPYMYVRMCSYYAGALAYLYKCIYCTVFSCTYVCIQLLLIFIIPSIRTYDICTVCTHSEFWSIHHKLFLKIT